MRAHRRVGAAVTALALALGGCGSPTRTPPGGPVFTTEDEPTATPTTPAAPVGVARLGDAPKPSRSASPKPPSPSRKPKPKRKPSAEKLPPAPPAPAPSSCKPTKRGNPASRAEVKAALTEAAGRTYWPTSAPALTVPVNLVKATAWQESGWQSDIVACDGGIGLMQVMPATADFVNQRFDQSYDVNAYRDNATLGANYLAWLVKYFGDVYFASDYTLDAADCADHRDACLLNAVISAYNVGPGAVDTDDGIVIPNARYVENVRALMTECECLSF
jgi:soluble lytic murein transglycosylase-like protein